jgi:hypothetical protein
VLEQDPYQIRIAHAGGMQERTPARRSPQIRIRVLGQDLSDQVQVTPRGSGREARGGLGRTSPMRARKWNQKGEPDG